MTRHRGILLSLAFVALMGLMGGQAHAGTLTAVLSWGSAAGEQLTVTGSPFATLSTTASGEESLTYNLTPTGLNHYLATHGSALQFGSGSGVLDNQAVATDTTGALLISNGTLTVASATGSTVMTITAWQTDYTSPMPQSKLSSTSNGTFSSATTGDNQSFNSWYNSNNVAPTTASGSGIVNAGPITTTVTAGGPGGDPIATVPGSLVTSPLAFSATFSLTNVETFSLNGVGASTTYGGQTAVTTTSIPEPASIVMMLTGMPVPLVVLGMLRRRKAKAASKS